MEVAACYLKMSDTSLSKEGENLVHFIMCVMSRVDTTSLCGGGLSQVPTHVRTQC